MEDTFICKEVYGRDIYFEISDQCFHLTSTDAEVVDIRSMDAFAFSQEETDFRIILNRIGYDMSAKFPSGEQDYFKLEV